MEDLRLPAQERGVALYLQAPAVTQAAAATQAPTAAQAAAAAAGPVQADGALLARALGNLLDNALRYTPAGGHITVAWRAAEGRVTFTVADTGPGIDPRDLPHLFQPLFRGEASRSRETGAAGLGLTIAQRILQAHGGDLSARNRPEGGAEFTGTFRG